MRILLGMSGGIDSTYAAVRLMREGHTVEGATLIMHEHTELEASRSAARSLGIPLHEIDCREPFARIVQSNFVEEYKNARTPNPCIICNSEIKFRFLLDYALANGFERIATGHYGKVVARDFESGVRYALKFAEDKRKDQSYMLWRLPQKVLEKLLLPLSDMTKESVRKDAKESDIIAADRADSQEICFLPDGDYPSFIEERSGGIKMGNFVDECGRIIAPHKGIVHYTVGQRRGLGISASSRIFVKEIDPISGDVVLSPNDPHATRVKLSGVVYSGIAPKDEAFEMKLSVKLRYAAPPVMATVKFFGTEAEVLLDSPHRAVTPGQSCVIYDNDILVAGGFIDSAT